MVWFDPFSGPTYTTLFLNRPHVPYIVSELVTFCSIKGNICLHPLGIFLSPSLPEQKPNILSLALHVVNPNNAGFNQTSAPRVVV